MPRSRSSQNTQPLFGARPREVADSESRVGEYGIVGALGHGATAHVYLGRHRYTAERVAIKILDPSYDPCGEVARRLLAEAEISARVRHPSLLHVRHAAHTAAGAPYLIMEYLDGESLVAFMERSDPPLEAILMIGCQIADAVAALHAAGVIHCDLKPSNIYVMFDPSPVNGWPRIKVVDYGVARLACDAPLPNGEIAGTPAFMAPEQWYGAPTPASDVYALGCLLFELVTGEPLFSGTLPRLMMQHCADLPDRPSMRRPDVPAALERLIVRALAKDPALRPSMAEVHLELARLGSGEVAGTLSAAG